MDHRPQFPPTETCPPISHLLFLLARCQNPSLPVLLPKRVQIEFIIGTLSKEKITLA